MGRGRPSGEWSGRSAGRSVRAARRSNERRTGGRQLSPSAAPEGALGTPRGPPFRCSSVSIDHHGLLSGVAGRPLLSTFDPATCSGSKIRARPLPIHGYKYAFWCAFAMAGQEVVATVVYAGRARRGSPVPVRRGRRGPREWQPRRGKPPPAWRGCCQRAWRRSGD
jgi:hypothetical protein